MKIEPCPSPIRRGALALVRVVLPPQAAPAGRLRFPPPVPVPRRWEAVVPCCLALAVAAAALATLAPAAFAGWRMCWLVFLAPAVLHLAMIGCGIAGLAGGRWLSPRWLFRGFQCVMLGIAATGHGWPRMVAVIAVAAIGLEGAARLLPANPPTPGDG